jgi:hypothetical protein
MSNDLIIPEVTSTPNQDDLSRVVNKGLAQIEEILDLDINVLTRNDDRLKMLSIKKDAATAIINAGLKADENRFRRENKDIIERLFTKVRKDSKMINGEVVHRI